MQVPTYEKSSVRKRGKEWNKKINPTVYLYYWNVVSVKNESLPI